MKKFIKELENIINEIINGVENKLTGINFLEALKFKMIPKLSNLLESSNLFDNLKNEEKILIKNNDKKIEVILKINSDLALKSKKKLVKNTLFLNIKGVLNLEIEENNSKNKKVSLNIYPLMGISLSSNTIVNLNSSKNSVIIEFLIAETNNNIENEKKSII